MNLGNFSVSLNVKNLNSSKEFYQKLGFVQFAGEESQGYLIMKNGDNIIGLFQGMFENNILTFNPGWDKNCQTLDDFDDIRQIQKSLKSDGINFLQEVNKDSSGPASFMIQDPDGNTILVDQHV